MPKRTIRLIVLLLLLFAISINTAHATENVLDTLFKPFENLDITKIYDSHSQFIDLIIYLIVFIGLSQTILSKRFQGRGGKAVIIAVGIFLSIGMVIAEKSYNFNVKTFGPIAACIVVLLISTVLFYTIKHIGAGNTSAGSIAFVLTYFLMRGLVPQVFDIIKKNEYTNWLHSLLFIIVIVIMVRGLINLLPGKSNFLNPSLVQPRSPKALWDKVFPAKEYEAEYDVIHKKLEDITKKDKKTSKEIISDISKLIKLVKEYGQNPEYRDALRNKLYEIVPKEHAIFEQINHIKELNNTIANFDVGVFKSVKNKYSVLSKEEKDLASREIKEELTKINVEKKIEEFADRALRYHENIKSCLKNADVNLENGWIGEVVKWLNQAVKYEENVEDLLNKMKSFEKVLEKITVDELKKIKNKEQSTV